MSEAEKIVEKVREMVAAVDMHRNREKRDVLDAIRELVGVVEKAPEPEPVVETPADDDAEPEAFDLDAATKAELVAHAGDLGLDVKGNKPDLIARIREHLTAVADAAPAEDAETPADDDADSGEQADADAAGVDGAPEPSEDTDATEDADADAETSRTPRVAEDTE